jgi:hypothetical protein
LVAVGLLADLDHRTCGELDAGVEGPVAWIECECGARIVRRVSEEPTCQPR